MGSSEHATAEKWVATLKTMMRSDDSAWLEGSRGGESWHVEAEQGRDSVV